MECGQARRGKGTHVVILPSIKLHLSLEAQTHGGEVVVLLRHIEGGATILHEGVELVRFSYKYKAATRSRGSKRGEMR